VALEQEAAWLSLDQMTGLFDQDKSVISRHIGNVFKEGELDRSSVVAKNATTAAGGKTYQVDYFNLDVIISVGYRVKSQRGVQFRKWPPKSSKTTWFKATPSTRAGLRSAVLSSSRRLVC